MPVLVTGMDCASARLWRCAGVDDVDGADDAEDVDDADGVDDANGVDDADIEADAPDALLFSSPFGCPFPRFFTIFLILSRSTSAIVRPEGSGSGIEIESGNESVEDALGDDADMDADALVEVSSRFIAGAVGSGGIVGDALGAPLGAATLGTATEGSFAGVVPAKGNNDICVTPMLPDGAGAAGAETGGDGSRLGFGSAAEGAGVPMGTVGTVGAVGAALGLVSSPQFKLVGDPDGSG
jgi:hypothetical protein